MNFEKTNEVELAVANHFGVRDYIIVPNVSWGMFGYELDLCVLNYRSFYAQEVEIKISKGDLKRDSKKAHHHDWNGNLIKALWFAMPEKLRGCDEYVPEHAGIMYVTKHGTVQIHRQPTVNRFAQKWSANDTLKLARLGTMRIWSLKRVIIQMANNKKANLEVRA